MANVCSSGPENIRTLCFSLKLYLYALSAYASGAGDDEVEQIISKYIEDAQMYLIGWLNRPDVDFGNYFGGKNCNKIKDEIKVCEYTIIVCYSLTTTSHYHMLKLFKVHMPED